MRQYPENGRHGFVLHDICWALLQKYFEPDEVPVERLVSVCRSIPFPLRGIGVCWGHDYGGLTTFDDQDHYPWEDRLTEQYNASPSHSKENPYDIPEILDLIVKTFRLPQTSRRPAQAMEILPGKDRFSKIPWEILEMIGVNLRITDVLSLARASRTFLPILSSQAFWASRFEPSRDRDFIFEKRNCTESRDWMTLYRLTSRASSPPGLKNRRRIWELVRAAGPSLRSRCDEILESSRANLLTGGQAWDEATGDIKPDIVDCYQGSFNEGCLLFQKQCAIMPVGLFKIGFSITAAGGVYRVTGMRFEFGSHPDVRLGYITDGNELFLDATALHGFVLAIDSSGIQALQVIYNGGCTSRWFGSPVNTPVTDRLTGFETITALEAGIDVCPLVILFSGDITLPH